MKKKEIVITFLGTFTTQQQERTRELVASEEAAWSHWTCTEAGLRCAGKLGYNVEEAFIFTDVSGMQIVVAKFTNEEMVALPRKLLYKIQLGGSAMMPKKSIATGTTATRRTINAGMTRSEARRLTLQKCTATS